MRQQDKISKRRTIRRPLDLLPGSVPVYRMAEQEFCELKVDIELHHPEIEQQARQLPELVGTMEALDRGKEFHDAASAEAAPIPRSEVTRLIRSGQPITLVESSLRGHYGRLPLIGRPDAIHFDGKGTAWVAEYKRRERPYVTPSDDVQLRLYAYLLLQEQMFDVEEVMLVGLLVSPTAAERIEAFDGDRKARLIRSACRKPPELFPSRRRHWSKLAVRGLGAAPVKTVTFLYDANKIRQELRFLSGYWLGRRTPRATTKATKCVVCRVNALGLCPRALAPYGASLRA